MASKRLRTAARQNVKKAAAAAKRKRAIAHLPKKVRTALGKEGAKAARKRSIPLREAMGRIPKPN
jgi:hypothetical protein